MTRFALTSLEDAFYDSLPESQPSDLVLEKIISCLIILHSKKHLEYNKFKEALSFSKELSESLKIPFTGTFFTMELIPVHAYHLLEQCRLQHGETVKLIETEFNNYLVKNQTSVDIEIQPD